MGEAEPLMLVEAREPIGKGVGQGQRPQRLPLQPVGQEPTRDATRRGLPKRSAEGFRWRQIGAIEEEPLSPKENPA